jgi:threonylcarbamoyladenosine tRNA methylthiotransferase MtaB
MFENSVDLVQQCQVVHGHIFPYSPKKGTPAARMPQVAPQVIKTRARALRDAVASERVDWLQCLLGSTQKIAVEKGGNAGHAENFAYVKLNRPMPEGSIVSAKVTDVKDGALLAEVVA